PAERLLVAQGRFDLGGEPDEAVGRSVERERGAFRKSREVVKGVLMSAFSIAVHPVTVRQYFSYLVLQTGEDALRKALEGPLPAAIVGNRSPLFPRKDVAKTSPGDGGSGTDSSCYDCPDILDLREVIREIPAGSLLERLTSCLGGGDAAGVDCNREYQFLRWYFTEKHPFLCDEYFDDCNQSMVGVTYNEARGYATYFGASLPTEAQWEYAAKRVADEVSGVRKCNCAGEATVGNHAFPWGNRAVTDTWPLPELMVSKVGSPEAGRGAIEMPVKGLAGGVWEWCVDAWLEDAGREVLEAAAAKAVDDEKKRVVSGGADPGAVEVRDPLIPGSVEDLYLVGGVVMMFRDDVREWQRLRIRSPDLARRVLRGGSRESFLPQAWTTFRYHEDRERRRGDVGFRLVYPPGS
ncbi:MAG: SUMF1/EgtB/PvdO family nonheme iron enzyme, partial [Magnetococcales bacterium]|nr:SUMF1/EgtB/PvdO family nonheme iron enzyme [Magnetococcales bacterium]